MLALLVAMCVLLSGVAPSVSRALAAAGAPGLHDLCVADAGGRPAPLPVGHHGDPGEPACALCAPHGGTHAAPPAAVPATAAGAVSRAVVHRLPAGVTARDAWIAAAPRGPPAVARPA